MKLAPSQLQLADASSHQLERVHGQLAASLLVADPAFVPRLDLHEVLIAILDARLHQDVPAALGPISRAHQKLIGVVLVAGPVSGGAAVQHRQCRHLPRLEAPLSVRWSGEARFAQQAGDTAQVRVGVARLVNRGLGGGFL